MNPKDKFINNLRKPNMTYASSMSKPKMTYANSVSSNGATSPNINTPVVKSGTPTVTPPTPILSPNAQSYAQFLYDTKTGARTAYGASMGVKDMLGGKEVTAPTTTPTTPVSQPESPYKKYLDTMTADAKRLADIQSEGDAKELESRRLYEETLNRPGGLLSGAQQAATSTSRKSNQELADLALRESAAARTAGVSQSAYEQVYKENQPIEVGGQLYQKQTDGTYKSIAGGDSAEGFTLGKDQVRYDAQGNVIAGGNTGTSDMGGVYTAGSNPTIDSYITGIKNNTLKIGDVPDEYKDMVAQGLTAKSTQVSDSGKQVLSIVDTLLANPKLGNISGLLGQTFLGGITGDAALAKNYYNQLTGILKLENRQQLKGSGAISDFEFKVLGQAATALGRNLDDKNFRNELQKLKDKLSGNAPIPTTPTDGDVWKAPDGNEYEFKKGSWTQTNQSFNDVGNTTASIPASSRLAKVNNNPGNLRYAGQSGATKGENGFAKFNTVEDGVKALKNQISLDASRGLTLAQFINKYAPPSENDTTRYIQDVIKYTGANPTTLIKNIDLNSLTKAIALKESGTKIA